MECMATAASNAPERSVPSTGMTLESHLLGLLHFGCTGFEKIKITHFFKQGHIEAAAPESGQLWA